MKVKPKIRLWALFVLLTFPITVPLIIAWEERDTISRIWRETISTVFRGAI